VAQLLHDFNAEFDTPTPGTVALAARLETLLQGAATLALLAGDAANGFALITLRPNVWHAGPVALLDELYVQPAARGQGVGTELIGCAVTALRDQGAELLEVNVDEGDSGARRFYERHGFTNRSRPEGDERMLSFERGI
jgi:GNAT superfamily N-acetyltransferase